MRPDLRGDSTIGIALVCDLLCSTGQARICATGTSMLPSIWPGDELVIQRISGSVSIGSVVAYLRDGRIFIHRVVSASPGQSMIITQGDRLAVPDPPFLKEELLGCVIRVSRDGKPVRLSARLAFYARLLRAVSQVSDKPTFALLKLRQWTRSKRSLAPS